MLSKQYLTKGCFLRGISRFQGCTGSKRLGNTSSNEYTATPRYPPILSREPKEVKKREFQSNTEKLKEVHTVEEKLFAINVPRYWGWVSVMINEGSVPYDFLPFVQHITRTKMIEVESLPVPVPDEKLKEITRKVKDQLEKIIAFELSYKNHKYLLGEAASELSDADINEATGRALVEQINRCILSNLSPHAPHLVDLLTDYEPRVEAFWSVGGFYISNDEKKPIKFYNDFWKRSNDNLDDPIDRWIQYQGSPILQLRSRFPLPAIADFPGLRQPETAVASTSDTDSNETVKSVNTAGTVVTEERKQRVFQVPSLKYDPRITHGLEFKRQYGLTVPGHFPNDRHEFGFLSYHKRGHMLGRPPNFGDEHDEALHSQAILASYGWLFGQACYQGFSTYNDPTYPLTAQTILTDGRLWSFYNYQLNTTTFYDDHIDTNPHENVCYGTKTTELFHSVEDGKIKGWNDKALETLFAFYLNKCYKREGVDMKPYLNPEEPLIEDIKDEEKRIWLHKQTRHLYPRRPTKDLPPTIYEWEQIYRIDNETMPMAARHKFYQQGLDPINETKWSHKTTRYIPKPLRKPDKRRQKFEKTFYPDIF